MGAFLDGTLVGIAGFYRSKNLKERHKGNIWGVYVTSAVRGAGIGLRVMIAVLKYATGLDGIEQIALLVATTQTAAKGLYESLGISILRLRTPGPENRSALCG